MVAATVQLTSTQMRIAELEGLRVAMKDRSPRAADVVQLAIDHIIRQDNANNEFRLALFTPDASAEAERARLEFLRTHPELAKKSLQGD